MTRKDYRLIASAIAEFVKEDPDLSGHCAPAAGQVSAQSDQRNAKYHATCQLVIKLAAALKRDDPNFKADMFLKAAGILPR